MTIFWPSILQGKRYSQSLCPARHLQMQHVLGLHPRETVDWPRSDSLAQRGRRHTGICNKVKLQQANLHFKILPSEYSSQITFCTYSRATSAFHILGLFGAPGNKRPTALHVPGCWNGFLPRHCIVTSTTSGRSHCHRTAHLTERMQILLLQTSSRQRGIILYYQYMIF